MVLHSHATTFLVTALSPHTTLQRHHVPRWDPPSPQERWLLDLSHARGPVGVLVLTSLGYPAGKEGGAQNYCICADPGFMIESNFEELAYVTATRALPR